MSEYSRVNAPIVFNDLIQNLKVRYIVTTYNNTYDSKNSSSRNKITLEQIQEILGSIVCWITKAKKKLKPDKQKLKTAKQVYRSVWLYGVKCPKKRSILLRDLYFSLSAITVLP